jgi:hypothetical protein
MNRVTTSGTKRNGHPVKGISYQLECGHHKFISRGDQVFKGRTFCTKCKTDQRLITA